MPALGIRLNNPGNLEQGQPWKGLAEKQLHSRFCTFVSPVFGIRAMARVLIGYQTRHDLRTLDQIIAKYAPKYNNNGTRENDTASYINFVAKSTGFSRAETLDLTDADTLAKLIPAMIRMEQGSMPYTKEEIAEAIRMAMKG